MKKLVKEPQYYLIYTLIFAFILVFSPLTAQAIPSLDFNISAPTAGTVSYIGGNNPLVGSNLEVDNVVSSDTALNNGVTLLLSNALLNFTTGNLSGTTVTTAEFSGNSALDAITLTGGIPALNIADGTLLMSGTITHASVVYLDPTLIDIMTFFDYKNPDLLDFYGLPMEGTSTIITGLDDFPYKGDLNLSFTGAGGLSPGDAFQNVNNLMSGDIHNYPTVPEPCTLILLSGLSLIGLGIIKRRKENGPRA